MLASLLIKALRPILVPLMVEALEQHARNTKPAPTVPPLYVNGSSVTTWLR